MFQEPLTEYIGQIENPGMWSAEDMHTYLFNNTGEKNTSWGEDRKQCLSFLNGGNAGSDAHISLAE